MFHLVKQMWLVTLLLICVVNATTKLADQAHLIGRYLQEVFEDGMNRYKADWSASGLQFGVVQKESNSSIAIEFRDCSGSCNYFVEAIVDCQAHTVTQISSDNNVLAISLPETIGGVHRVEVYKRTEGSNGDATGWMVLDDLSLVAGAGVHVLPRDSIPVFGMNTCTPTTTRFLVIGDSMSAAYGVDGEMPCSFTADTENALHSWASLTATHFNAMTHIIAWSGKGVVRNYGDANPTSTTPMPALYNRTLASTAAYYWDPNDHVYDPHIILILLGTNDFSTEPVPSEEQFVGGMVDFLHQLQGAYPSSALGAICSPALTTTQCGYIAAAVAKVSGVYYMHMPPETNVQPNGCDYHPSAKAQQLMAEAVFPTIQTMIDTLV